MPLNPSRWLDRLGSQHRRIFKAMMLVSGFVLIGKFAGAAREMAIAWRYGVSSVVDVYVFGFLLVSWVPMIVTSVLNAVLVPLTRRLEPDERERFAAQLAGVMGLVGIVLVLLMLTVVPALSGWLSTGFDEPAAAALQDVIRALSPAAAMMLFTALFSAQLLAREKHANTLLEAVPALFVLVLVVFWPGDAGYAPLVWGTIVGLAAQLLLLGGLMARGGFHARVSLRFDHPAWRDFRSAVSTLLVGTIIMGLAAPIDQLIAAQLGEGSIASLSYATRLLALGLGLGATAVGRAILPVLSDTSDTVAVRTRLARQWCLLLFAAGVVTAAAAWQLTPWAVALIFERGAFTSENTLQVSEVVRYGLTQLPFYFSGIVLVQLMASLGYYTTIVYSSVIAISVKVSTGFMLGAWLGVAGITLSTGLMYLATCLFFLWRTSHLAQRS